MPRKSGSVGGLGGRPPRSTRPVETPWDVNVLVLASPIVTPDLKNWVAGAAQKLRAAFEQEDGAFRARRARCVARCVRRRSSARS